MTRTVALLLTLAVASMMAIHSSAYFFSQPIYEIGDQAANSLAVDRAKHFAELYGPYSRWGFHHPGPALFYVQALGEWLFFDTLRMVPAPYNGQALICVFVEFGFFVAALQVFLQWLPARCRWWFFPLALALAALHFANPAPGAAAALAASDAFQTTWSAHLVVLPFLCLLAASASVGAGRAEELPLLVIAGGCLVHLHVAEPMFVVPCSLLAYAGLIGAQAEVKANGGVGRFRGGSFVDLLVTPWRRQRRAHLTAGILLCLFLLPIVWDLTRGAQSNFAAILENLRSNHDPHKSWLKSALYFLQFGAYASYQASQEAFGHYNGAGLSRYLHAYAPYFALWAVVYGLAAALLFRYLGALASKRAIDPTAKFLGWAAAILFLATALTLRWGVIQAGDMFYYNAWFNFAIYFFAALVAAAWVTRAVLPLVERVGFRGVSRGELGVAMLAIVISAVCLVGNLTIAEPDWSNRIAMHERVAKVIADSKAPNTVKFLDFPQLTWPVTAGVALQLDRANQPYVVPARWAVMFGSEHVQKPALAALERTDFQRWSVLDAAETKTPANPARKLVALEEGDALTVDSPVTIDLDKDGSWALDFKLGAVAPDFEIAGWSGSEKWGEWTDGKWAVLAFRAAPVSGNVALTLQAFPYLDPAHGLSAQRLRVAFNGERLGPELRLDRPDPPPIVLTIPRAIWNRVHNGPQPNAVLELEFPDAISPQALDPAKPGDVRVVALGVRRILLQETGASSTAIPSSAGPQPAQDTNVPADVPSEEVFNGQPQKRPFSTGISVDGWAGKQATVLLPPDRDGQAPYLRLEGLAPQRAGLVYPYRFTAQVDDGELTTGSIGTPGPFTLLLPLPPVADSAAAAITVHLNFPQSFVPAQTDPGSNDQRELAMLLHAISITSTAQPLFAGFQQGWYDKETASQNWWRWSPGKGVVELAADRAGTLVVQGGIGALAPGNDVSILLDGTPFSSLPIKNLGWAPFAARVPISAGKHTLTFQSRLPGVPPPGDSRTIAFGLQNAVFQLER